MPYIIRQSQHYWMLAACLVLIAILYKADFQQSAPAIYDHSRSSAQTLTETQSQALESVVSGSIGIDKERGDSVTVNTRL